MGRWIDNTPFTGGVIVIYRNEGRLFVHLTLAAGGELKHEVTEHRVGRETRYEIMDNDFGEYYVIEGGGDLGIYDREGLITTARARQ